MTLALSYPATIPLSKRALTHLADRTPAHRRHGIDARLRL